MVPHESHHDLPAVRLLVQALQVHHRYIPSGDRYGHTHGSQKASWHHNRLFCWTKDAPIIFLGGYQGPRARRSRNVKSEYDPEEFDPTHSRGRPTRRDRVVPHNQKGGCQEKFVLVKGRGDGNAVLLPDYKKVSSGSALER